MVDIGPQFLLHFVCASLMAKSWKNSNSTGCEHMIRCVQVRVINAASSRAWLKAGEYHVPCLIGRHGLTARKREGDGMTPIGRFRLLYLLSRARMPVATRLPARTIRSDDAWCDAPFHPSYNRAVKRPFAASHEVIARRETAYDYCVVLDCNIRPRVQGRGSAIFFHLIHEGSQATAGCIAVEHKHMAVILRYVGPDTKVLIGNVSVPRPAHQK
jgi:L,D-peptidoglycan transpeptidase YkuD (ErfK/YbiS/YcfS/YnhG family)